MVTKPAEYGLSQAASQRGHLPRNRSQAVRQARFRRYASPAEYGSPWTPVKTPRGQEFARGFRTVPTAILVLLLFQAGTVRPISPPQVQKSQSFLEESPQDAAAYEERELIRRLNALAKALNAFGATYKSGQVDLNEVKAVRKALHELERSELFRPQKTK